MSFKEQRTLPPRQGIFRSRSFAGFINNRGMTSPTSPMGTPILGQGLRSPQAVSRKPSHSLGSSFSKKGTQKLPKVPRPNRALVIFHHVRKGLQECIGATREDIDALRVSEDLSAASSTGQGRIVELEKQVKAAERYQKKLEFHLAKLEELEDNYKLQLQLREGVRTMAKAYVSSEGESKKESLLQVKSGFKECTQTMCAIEAQLENMMGTFHCTMKGLVGFARLIPGDVFEVTMKHGQQKWRTKGRVGTNSQSWDNENHVFKAMVGDIFSIKAQENKSLKSVVLGSKNCETKDLFSSHPQLMTVSININGSIKLSILINWNPLEGMDESWQPYEPAPRAATTPRRRLVHSMYINASDSYSDLSSELSGSSGSVPSSHRFSLPAFPPQSTYTPISTSPSYHNVHASSQHNTTSPTAYQSPYQPPGGATRPNSIAIMGTISELDATDSVLGSVSRKTEEQAASASKQTAVKPKLFDMRLLRDSLEEEGVRNLGMRGEEGLEEALGALRGALEDYQGRYEELRALEEEVSHLDRMVRHRGGGASPTREISISIENALGAFDFLESSEYFHDGYGSGKASRRSSLDQLESQCTLSPESTAKTADSGIECIATRLSEDGRLDSSTSSPEPLSTGNEEVDTALVWHLQYCERLLQHLGNFGPLKCREIYALDKLKRQASTIHSLMEIASKGPVVKDLQEAMSGLTKSKELRQFWVKCVDTTVLYINAEKFLAQLERSFGDTVREKYEVSASTVFRTLVAKMLDVPLFNPEICKPCPNLTMHQIFSYFSSSSSSSQHNTHILTHIHDLAGELWVVERLHSGSTDLVIKTVLTFRDSVPPAECLRVMVLLLTCDNMEVRNAVATYIKSVGLNERNRKQALVILVEALEEMSADLRCAAVIALRLLQATECLQQLVYLSQTDQSHHVRHNAKETVFSFGEEGRQAFEESQRTSHGFQGVTMKL